MDTSPIRYDFGAFELDPLDKVLRHGGQAVSLTPKAFDTLLVLVERHGRLVTKEELLRLVWPGTFVEENNLAQNISAIRRALGESDGDRFIETVPKRGYRFVAAVNEANFSASPKGVVQPPTAQQPTVAGASADAPTTAAPASMGLGTRQRPMPLWALAVGAALLLGAIALPALRKRAVVAGSAGAAAAPMAVSTAHRNVTRIAVLPMVNLGPPADASFVAGLTEELISRLAALRRVAVPSSTTLAAYDRRGKTLALVGADLRVDYVVEGSVRWVGEGDEARVRMNPRLVRVADDTTVWTRQYDASVHDLFAVQAEIARHIAEASQLALDSSELQTVATKPTGDVDAYVAYLRGLAWYRQGTSDTANIAAARADLERAVARDPRFAEAWSWLARVYAAEYRTGAARTPEIMTKGLQAAQQAITLAPDRADVRLGRVDMLSLAPDETAKSELDALRVALPNSSEVLYRVAIVDRSQGRWRESEAALLQAFELDPPAYAEQMAVHYLHLRQYDDARRYVGVGQAANQNGVTVPHAWTYFSDSGDLDQARRVLENARRSRAVPDSRVLGLLARFEWFAGRPQRALELTAMMDAAGSWLAPNFRFPAALAAAQIHDSLGRRGEARRLYAEAHAAMQRPGVVHDVRYDSVMAQTLAGLDRPDEALAHARRAVETLTAAGVAPELPLHLYFKAIVHARNGDLAGCMATLDQLFSRAGFYSDQWVRHDPSFAALRRHPGYAAAIERWSRQRGLSVLEAGHAIGMRAEGAPAR